MEPVVFTLVFAIAIAAFVALHVWAGLAEDAQWSRQQMLIGHGVQLGLSTHEWESSRPTFAVAPVGPTRGISSSPRPAGEATARRQDEFTGWTAPQSVVVNG